MGGGAGDAWIFWAVLVVLGGAVGFAAWWKRKHSSLAEFDDESSAKTKGK